jgi:hypothetical protein
MHDAVSSLFGCGPNPRTLVAVPCGDGSPRTVTGGETFLDFATYDAICKLFGRPQAFIQSAGRRQHSGPRT